MSKEVRLQKFLAESGVASRRQAEKLILEGKVRVNGKTIQVLGTKVNPELDTVQIGNLTLQKVKKGILLFHKPRGVVSTLKDPEGRPCVGDYVTKKYRSYYPVGRLDWETTGLLVLTNDGELAEHLAHPRFKFVRCYHARVEGIADERIIAKIARGVRLHDGVVSGDVKILKGDSRTTWIEIKLKEGKNRVVRRLMEKLEFPVLKLKRVQHGPFKLGGLAPGQMRALSEREYNRLRRLVFEGKAYEEIRVDRRSAKDERRNR